MVCSVVRSTFTHGYLTKYCFDSAYYFENLFPLNKRSLLEQSKNELL